MKTIFIIALCFITATVLSNDIDTKQMKLAYMNKDYVLSVSKADKLIADENSTIEVKAMAQRYKGFNYLGQKEYAKAKVAFLKVISDYPTLRDHGSINYSCIGYSYVIQGNDTEAIAFYQKATDNYPERFESIYAKVAIAKIYNRQKEYVKAQEVYKSICTSQTATISQIKTAFSKVDKITILNRRKQNEK